VAVGRLGLPMNHVKRKRLQHVYGLFGGVLAPGGYLKVIWGMRVFLLKGIEGIRISDVDLRISEVGTDPDYRNRLWPDSAFFVRTRNRTRSQ